MFSKALRFLSDKLVTFIRRTLEGGADVLKQNGIVWVITVPAIWDPRARQFMRKAAYKVCWCGWVGGGGGGGAGGGVDWVCGCVCAVVTVQHGGPLG